MKALPPALSDAWAQAPRETDDEYEAFLVWLDAGDNRKNPSPKWQTAATRYGWAERVVAYERGVVLSKPDAEPPEIQITANLMHLAQLESGKLLRQSATSIGPVIGVTELVRVLAFLADMQRATLGAAPTTRTAPADEATLKKMPIEDLRKLYEANEIIRRAKGL